MSSPDTPGLTQRGTPVAPPDNPVKAAPERVPNPHAGTDYPVRFSMPEFISLCPITGQADFAHLVITLVRASTIPARMVSVYAPNIDPPDFHAVVEVWLGGSWHLIDPSRLGREEDFVRIAYGRDATDISFMTIFGQA